MTAAVSCVVFIVVFLCVIFFRSHSSKANAEEVDSYDINPGYKLKRMVLFSRHSNRAPLENTIPLLSRITPHKWNEWTSRPGELTLRGGIVESLMGQYCRNLLEGGGFIPNDWDPAENEVRFRANSIQRTVATARYFATGFMPCHDVKIEHRSPLGKPDPDIATVFHFANDEYRAKTTADIVTRAGCRKLTDFYDLIRDGLNVLEKALDYKDSDFAKQTGTEHIPTDKLELVIETNRSPFPNGGIMIAFAAAEALSLQYLEEPDNSKLFFGHRLTDKEFEDAINIIDISYKAMFGTPTVALNIAHPVLIDLKNELLNKERRFSYICGHDTNIITLTSALGFAPYKLQKIIGSSLAPIGCKLAFCVYDGPDGKEYAYVLMTYLSIDQIQNRTELNPSVLPMCAVLSLDGLKRNAEDFYLFDDLISRFDEAIDAYDTLPGNG